MSEKTFFLNYSSGDISKLNPYVLVVCVLKS